jgi:hypothetical protein
MTVESLAEKSAEENRGLGDQAKGSDPGIARTKPGKGAGGKRLMVG